MYGSWAEPFRRWRTCQRAAASAARRTVTHSFIKHLLSKTLIGRSLAQAAASAGIFLLDAGPVFTPGPAMDPAKIVWRTISI